LYFERDAAGDLLPFHAYPRDALVSISTHDLPTLAGFWSGRDIVDRLRVGHLETASAQAVWDDRRGHKEKMVERLVKDGFLPAQSAEHLLRETAPTDELHSAVLGFLFHTPSRLVMINQEDIFLDIRQQNIPGTTWENPNWVTKMLYTIEELESHPDALRQSGKFRKLLEGSGRPTTSRNRPY
jgi:4-alpha-glucanotransferase